MHALYWRQPLSPFPSCGIFRGPGFAPTKPTSIGCFYGLRRGPPVTGGHDLAGRIVKHGAVLCVAADPNCVWLRSQRDGMQAALDSGCIISLIPPPMCSVMMMAAGAQSMPGVTFAAYRGFDDPEDDEFDPQDFHYEHVICRCAAPTPHP